MALRSLKNINKYFEWNKKTAIWALIAILVALFFAYDYHNILSKPPQSVHAWRQADCASQAVNYAHRDANFFKTQIHCQVSNDLQTGHCMEEFPILYYFVGVLFKIFGHHDILFRLTNLLIFVIGLFFLFRLYEKATKNNFWSVSFTVLLFTAPVLVFYANNFILNTPAFALTLVGWYYFFGYLENQRQRFFIISMAIFTLAALLKISELISVFTLIGILFLDLTKMVSFSKNGRLFKKPVLAASVAFISLAVVFVWYYYSHYYNNLHGQTYYAYTTGDYFSLSKEVRSLTTTFITEYWKFYYHNGIALWFYGITMVVNLLFIKKVNKLFMAITSIMFIGSVMFVFLFFDYLRNHDYYIISLYITTIFSTITFVELLSRNYAKIINSWITKTVFLIFLVYGTIYAADKMNVRYYGWENEVYLSERTDLYYIKPYLKEIGVSKDSKIISIPDPTLNLTLYLMNRLGWTNFTEHNNSKLIPMAIDRGAEYLVINDPRLLFEEDIKPFLYHKIGEFRNTHIYKLDNVPNDSFDRDNTLDSIFWDMETLSDDGEYLISDTLTRTISSGYLSDEISFSGTKSLKVQPGHFALNYSEDTVVENQKYHLSLKVFAKQPMTSKLIICVSSPDEFYLPVGPVREINSSGWHQIEAQFRVPPNIKNKRLSIDFYNTDDFVIFIDDFSITKFKH